MGAIASQTTTGALSNLTRLHQAVLDGVVDAVTASGLLLVNVGRGSLYAGAVVDIRFRAGDHVRMMHADDGTYQVTGLATAGGRARTKVLPQVDSPPPSGSSPSLHAALVRYSAKDSQALKRGIVTAVRSDGTLEVRIKGRPQVATAATSRPLRAGDRVYAVKTDLGGYEVMGP